MTADLAVAINSRTRDIIHEWGLHEAGDFSKAFSARAAQLLVGGSSLEAAINEALQETGTDFRRMNPRVASRFKAELERRSTAVVSPTKTVRSILLEFRTYAERQLVHGFATNHNEEFCRSNMQTYLEQAGRTTREVRSGGGWIDIVVQTGEPVEAKLWKGPAYHDAGIEELREYMRTERQNAGYYVVFDTLPDNPRLAHDHQFFVPEGQVVQIGIRMSPGAPSKRRKVRAR